MKLHWTLRSVASLAVLAAVPLLALAVFGPASLSSRSTEVPALAGYAPWEGARERVQPMKRGQPPAKASEVEILLNNWRYTATTTSPSGPAIRNRG